MFSSIASSISAYKCLVINNNNQKCIKNNFQNNCLP